MRNLIALLASLFLISAVANAAVDPTLSQAEALYRAGKTEEGKRIVTAYVTNHENVTGYISVGNLYARLKLWPDSVHYLEIATTRDPHSALAFYELGLAQHQNKQIDPAIDSLRRSLQISSGTAKTYWALGQILELSDDRYDARNTYMTSLKKAGESAAVRARLCWLFFRDNYPTEAIKQCAAAVKLNPNDVISASIMARSHYDNHENKLAFAAFHDVLQKHPDSGIAYRARGLIYLQEKSYEQASLDLGKAFGLNPNDDEAAIGLARSLFESGHYAEALPVYVEACKLDRNYRYEFLAKQREVSRKNQEELAQKYQEAVDRF